MRIVFLCLALALLAATAQAQTALKAGNIWLKSGSALLGASANANRYMLFNTRSRIASNAAAVPPNVSVVSRILFNTPGWAPKNPKIYFPCWYGLNTGAYPVEQAPSGSCTIDGATLEYPANSFTAITFVGAASVTIAAGSGVWSDAVAVTLPANSTGFVRSSWTVASGATLFGNYNTQQANGEGASYAAAPQTALLTSTGFAASASAGVPGPSLFAAQGWDGSPVGLVTGDSIGYGLYEDEQYPGNARGDFGYLARGFDDNAASARVAAAFVTVPGASEGSDANAAAGYFGRRIAMLNGLPNIPFTFILSEHGANDNSSADLQSWWTFLKANWNVHLYQTTILPHTATASNTAYDSYAAQSPVNGAYTYPAGAVWANNTALLAGGYNASVSGVIDVNPYASGAAGGYPDRWYVPAFTGSLASSVSSGAFTLSLNAAPALGDCLVLGSGSASVDAGTGLYGLPVTAVSGSGPAAVSTLSATAASHTGGVAVTEQSSHDGLHPCQAMHLRLMSAVIAAKNAGLIH